MPRFVSKKTWLALGSSAITLLGIVSHADEARLSEISQMKTYGCEIVYEDMHESVYLSKISAESAIDAIKIAIATTNTLSIGASIFRGDNGFGGAGGHASIISRDGKYGRINNSFFSLSSDPTDVICKQK